MSHMVLQDFMWEVFRTTGTISAYLVYRQMKNLHKSSAKLDSAKKAPLKAGI